jgi:hypothetical protein
MFHANAYIIRHAIAADERAIAELAELDSQRPLIGPALIGEIDGQPAAAISLADGRVVADPFQATARLRPLLRMRSQALQAAARTPSITERVRAAIGTVPVARAIAA